MQDEEATPRDARPKRWLGAIPFVSVAIAVASIVLLNHYVHGVFIMGRGQVESLRLMTWNIGKLYLPLDSRAADRDLAHVAKVIREIDPHVIALQELRDQRQLGRLVSALGSRYRGYLPHDQYDRRAALISRLPVRFVPLSTSTGRTAQGGEVTIAGGEVVTMVSLHLDAFDAERRERQAEEIIAHVSRLGNEGVFLIGDFNFDAARHQDDATGQRLYRLLTRDLVDAGERAGGTTVVSRRLDYVFYRSARVRRVRAKVLRGRRINIMDHLPLVVEFSLRPPASRSALEQ